jgi:preprotein translocase subunit SecA
VVTIATNMAGRGTDIVLGGNLEAELAQAGDALDRGEREKSGGLEDAPPGVIEAGGLHT